MVSQITQKLGKEKYFCIENSENELSEEGEVNTKSWRCLCCDNPVIIDAVDVEGKKERYFRIPVNEVIKEDYVYIPQSGFLRVLAAGKEKNGYFLALKSYRKLTGLTDKHFCLIYPSGRMFPVHA